MGRDRLRAIMVVLCSLGSAACDGHLSLAGQVYEWVEPDPGAKSFVVVDSLSRALPTRLAPLPGAEATIEPWTPAERAQKPEVWVKKATTDATGSFKVAGTVKPGWFDATLSVHCAGFQSVEHVFRHNRYDHRAVVVLVREP